MPKGLLSALFISFLLLLYCTKGLGQNSMVYARTDSTKISSLEKELQVLKTQDQLSALDSVRQIEILDSLCFLYKPISSKKFNFYLTEKSNFLFSYVIPSELPKEEKNYINIRQKIGIWKDSTKGKITIKEVVKASASLFSPNDIEANNMEVNGYYWLRLKLLGNSIKKERVALQIGTVFEQWSEIEIYKGTEEGGFRIERSGSSLDPAYKPINQWRNYFFIDVPAQGERLVYVRIHSEALRYHPKKIILSVGDAADVSIGSDEFTYTQGVFQGILWVMIFYNLLLFFIIRDKLYLYYVLMILGIQLNVLYYYRYIYFIFPTSQHLLQTFVVVSHLLMIGGGLLFMRNFLNIRELLLRWSKFIDILNGILLISTLFFVFDNLLAQEPNWTDNALVYALPIIVNISIGILGGILGIFLGVITLQKGYSAARYYLIATSFLLIGGVFYGVSYLLNESVNTDIFIHLFQAGVVVQLVFYALGIGYQVNRLEREKSDALAENLELQKETTALLEKKVRQRTIEIERQKEEIEAINTNLTEQKNLMEKRSQDIASSINYARRIQDAVLPDLRAFKRNVPSYFVLYKPRDIVSGDFYWFAQKEGQLVLAVADCTEQGVPGAFMSILGDSYLNQIVNLQGITKADFILSHLHEQVRRALRQSSSENKDGMDISICVIDLEQKKVNFAGAKRPLLYIQNDTIFEIKGDKRSVGEFHTKAENNYTLHTINIREKTSFYIFSDGYTDQLGGEKNRKFMVGNFKKLLLEIHEEPMVRQRQLLDIHFEGWKRENKQIDDVLVVAFEIEP